MSHWNSFVRIPALAIRHRIRPLPRIGTFEEDVLRMRVGLQDIDFNLHLNNARYLSFMDYGRVHLMAASGILTPVLREKWTPLVGSVSITYRRSLALFQTFTLSTRVLCWDEKWFYMEQIFYGSKGLATHAWVKMLFRGPSGNLPPQIIADRISPGAVSPPLSARLKEWNAAIRDTLHEKEPAHAR